MEIFIVIGSIVLYAVISAMVIGFLYDTRECSADTFPVVIAGLGWIIWLPIYLLCKFIIFPIFRAPFRLGEKIKRKVNNYL